MEIKEQDIRTASLIGKEKMQLLYNSHIAIIGLGGVGGHALDAIVRAGVGEVTIVDGDAVSTSNINRQMIANHTTVGRQKVDVFEEHIKKINPSCTVHKINEFIHPDTLGQLDFSSFDYVVDAVDSVKTKLALAELCYKKSIPIISSMGTGNKLHPELLEVTDIYKTSVCPLARVVRCELRRMNVPSLTVVYSKEIPKVPIDIYAESVADDSSCAADSEEPSIPSDGTMIKADGKKSPASISFIPAAAGLLIASRVIGDIIQE